ncbi:MAG: hypothetical protein GXO78_13835 [Calditrichaeota bacterium]|nr:hypothetical protein [Calditrichota bacterium]
MGVRKQTVLWTMLVVVTLCLSCAHYAQVPLSSQDFPEADWRSVQVYGTIPKGMRYQVVGVVSYYGLGSFGETAVEEIKKQAAKLGATAVINFEINLINGRVQAEGIAVRQQ